VIAAAALALALAAFAGASFAHAATHTSGALKTRTVAHTTVHVSASHNARHGARTLNDSHTCPGGWNISRWTCNAAHVLRHAGYHVGRSEEGAVKIIAAHESGNNPGAVNNWDSNAAAGTPSQGLMQTIAPTFRTYKLRGHGNMLNPVSDIIAAFRYAVDRYGSVNSVPGVQAVRGGGAYVGY
jgi:hypothetical protein